MGINALPVRIISYYGKFQDSTNAGDSGRNSLDIFVDRDAEESDLNVSTDSLY